MIRENFSPQKLGIEQFVKLFPLKNNPLYGIQITMATFIQGGGNIYKVTATFASSSKCNCIYVVPVTFTSQQWQPCFLYTVTASFTSCNSICTHSDDNLYTTVMGTVIATFMNSGNSICTQWQ